MSFDLLIHLVLLLLLPPFLLGVVNKTKALFAGRKGPPWLQVYYDLAKLVRKGSVFSRTTSWVFRAGPAVGLVTVILAGLMIPQGGHLAPVNFEGDLILVAYLLGLGRFFTVAAALDTGSAFEGMGSAREVTFSALTEPALFLGLFVLVRSSHSLSLSRMFGDSLPQSLGVSGASLVLVLVSLFIVMLAENSRIPVDDPETHLELTMIHEVMVLDHSGPAFGMILYSAAVKFFVLGALVARLAVPFDVGLWAWPVFMLATLGVAVLVGVVESVMARLRMVHVPSLLIAACLLSAFGVVLLVR